MSRWRCDGCQTVYAVRLTRCPRCHTETFREETVMPKISRHAGATNAGAAVEPTPAAAPDQTEEAPVLWHCLDCTTAYAVGSPACPHCGSRRHADQPAAPEPVQAPAEGEQAPGLPLAQEEGGGEGSSPGSSFSASTPRPETSSGPTPSSRPSRARKTASRSRKAQTDSSSAGGTGGGQTDRTSEPDEDADGEGEPASE